MYAQNHSRNSASSKAAVALLLLEANAAYGESNSSQRSFVQRVRSRQECRGQLNEVLTLEPANAAALGLLGRVEMDDGSLEQAHVLFTTSLRQDAHQPQQYTNLGYWALASERPALAQEYFQEALALDRQSAAAFCGIAHAKRQQGLFDVAYMHYRKLVELELEWPSIYSGMLVCAENLKIDRADDELVRDAVALLRREDLPHQQLGHFVASIIRHRYNLNDPDAQINLDEAADDELFVLALQKTLMPDPAVEELAGMLRRAVIAEVAGTAALREGLQTLAMALALYADRTGYALAVEDDEANLIDAINGSISAQFALGESMDDMAGSLILSAMYGALFHQEFSVQLGQWNLVDWSPGLQTLMASSYYERATDEAIKQNFDEKAEELCLDRMDVPQAWPSWAHLAYRNETSLKALMASELKLPTASLPDTLRLMVCGAESGQRALELARYLDDVEVIAVDESLANIAKATRRSQELGLNNVVFWPWSIAQRFVADGHKVHWIEIGRLPSVHMTEVSLPALASCATESGSVIHMHTAIAEQSAGDRHIRKLIQEHGLTATRANLRRLRRMVLNNRQDAIWQDLISESDFYGLGGCQDRWFRPQDTAQLEQLMAMMSNEVDWKLVKARDSDGHSLATGPVQKQLQAEALGSQVQSLMGQSLSVYFVRRR
ncbi:tetratricopeptide repeat protein [Marinobacter sp.]|uniref:tetratricopeptide repeat protein n=1 Tax=Marinobacter sp. TaxID=50741 RepID=UPI00384BC4E5